MSWYGVQDVADPGNTTCFTDNMDSSCDAATAVKNAFLASAKYGDGGVTTDGRSIAILSHCGGCIETDSGIEIPEGQYLTCGAPPGARRDWGTSPDHDPDAFSAAPASIVLDPQFFISRHKNTRLSYCFLRPEWLYPHAEDSSGLVIPPANVKQLVQMTHKFTGTATKCNNDGCNMDHVTIMGFDICDDSSGANLAVISDVIEDCPTGEWVHASGGGGPKLRNVTADPVLEGSLDPHIQSLCYPITNMTLNGTDGVTVRVETGGTGVAGCDPDDTSTPGDQLQSAGDTVLIAGLGLGKQAASPVSANGRWLTSLVAPVAGSTTLYDVTLTGASWAGPTVTAGAWKAGAPVITVTDNTNIIPGQYVCASPLSGTPPFCSPPSGFGFSTVASTNLNSIHAGGTGNIGVTGSLAGWPALGLVHVDSETMRYIIVNASTVDITERGVDGTTGASHADISTMTPAAPVVLSVPPSVVAAGTVAGASEAVIVSAPAQSPGSASVKFANDQTLWLKAGTTSYGSLYLDASYRSWTGNNAAGNGPTGIVTVNSTADSSMSTLTPGANVWKVQPGMLAIDLTPGHSGYLTHDGPTMGSTLPGAILAGPPTGSAFNVASGSHISPLFAGTDLVQYSGCGYPGLLPYDSGSSAPWLGNCAATGLLIGGTGLENETGSQADDEVQGTFCNTIKTAAVQIAIHVLDSPATACSDLIATSNTDLGGVYDPDSVSLWIDSAAGKSQYSTGRLGGGVNAILDTPDVHGQPDGVGIVNMQTENNIALGTGANATIVAAHGDPSLANPTLFASSGATRVQMSSIDLPGWSVVTDDPAAFPNLYCAGNVFLTAPCSQVMGTPTCILGCAALTDVSGNDSSFDVKVSSGSTSVTVQLAGKYAIMPICTVSPGVNSLGASVSASVSPVSFQPWGTIISFKMSGAVSHIYGSCRGATG